MSDSAAALYETATYCKANDPKTPTLVGLPDFTVQEICPADGHEVKDAVTNAAPTGWYVRVMFDELLDTSVEELVPILDQDGAETGTFSGSIKNTKPATLKCTSVTGGALVDIPYDGYYSPSGNATTWPLGPSLVIAPDDPTLIATGSECQVTINENVKDKDGNPVPAAQRGPFKFRVAPIQVVLIDPGNESKVDPLLLWTDGFYVQFNTAIDDTSICDEGAGMDECEFELVPHEGFCDNSTGTGSGQLCSLAPGATACPTGEMCIDAGVYSFPLAAIGFTEAEFAFGANVPQQADTAYTFQFKAGGKIKDLCGAETTLPAPSVADQTKVSIMTNPFTLKTLTPGNGDLVAPISRPRANFSNVVDGSTLASTEFSITPAPDAQVVFSSTGGDQVIGGYYNINTEYTLTINAGAKISDAWGKETTVATEKKVTFKTQPDIRITSTLPADKGTITKATPTSTTRVTMSFNQAMQATTLLPTEVSLTPLPTGTVITISTASGCSATSSTCSLAATFTPSLPPGNYVFKVNAGATINDKRTTPNTYTQAADRVVNFTVKDAAPTPPPRSCF